MSDRTADGDRKCGLAGKKCIASHRDVVQFIKEHQICSAEDLFHAGEQLSAEGDQRILAYCMGADGRMKKTLKAIVKKACVDRRIESAPDRCDKLCNNDDVATETKVETLKKRAREPHQPQAKSEVRQVQRRVGSNLARIMHNKSDIQEMEVRNFRNQKQVMVKDIVLFDSYERRAELVFEAKNGSWRLRDYYELLVECRRDDVLAGIRPSHSVEGGFSIPRTESGWHQMLRSKVSQVRKPFVDLTSDEHAAAAADLRFGLGCGSLRWAPPCSIQPHLMADAWVDLMPEDPSFEMNKLSSLVPEERLVRLWAYGHVEDRQLQAFTRILEECGHKIHQTIGFRISKNSTTNNLFCVTGSRAGASRHKAAANSNLPFALCTSQLDCDSEASQFSPLRTSADVLPTAVRKGSRGATKLRALLPKNTLAIKDAAELPHLALLDAVLSTGEDKEEQTPPALKKLRICKADVQRKVVYRRPALADSC